MWFVLILHSKTMNLGLGNTKIAPLSVAIEGEMASFCAEAAAVGLLSAPCVYQSQDCYQFSESCSPEWEQPCRFSSYRHLWREGSQ